MVAHIELVSELNEIVPLLAECGLSVSDISSSQPPVFFGVRFESGLSAVVGLEIFGSVGLLAREQIAPALHLLFRPPCSSQACVLRRLHFFASLSQG